MDTVNPSLEDILTPSVDDVLPDALVMPKETQSRLFVMLGVTMILAAVYIFVLPRVVDAIVSRRTGKKVDKYQEGWQDGYQASIVDANRAAEQQQEIKPLFPVVEPEKPTPVDDDEDDAPTADELMVIVEATKPAADSE
jgi:hypothetical protein